MMALEVLLACKKCSFLTATDPCPQCGGQMSKEWQGYLVILDPDRSEIARKMGITQAGKYALRVR